MSQATFQNESQNKSQSQTQQSLQRRARLKADSKSAVAANVVGQHRAFLEDNRSHNTPLQRQTVQQPALQKQTNQDQALQKQASVNNTGLPDNLKSGMENLSGMSLDHVRVHYNSSQPAAVQAHAFAQGSNIHLASGQEKHLPHELGHVVQQMEGRVKATTNVNGMAVNDNAGLESEATKLGERALM